MAKFPVDAPLARIIKALERMGFALDRQGNHLILVREEPDGTRTPLILPNHRNIKGSTLRSILTQSGLSRDEFLRAYERS